MSGLTAMERERAQRIEENRQRMCELGLDEAVNNMKQASQASQRAPAAAKPRPPKSAQFVDVKEEDLRRSGRSKKDVNYNEHTISKLAEQALREERRSRTYRVKKSSGSGRGGRAGGGRSARAWNPSKGVAGYAARDRCEEAGQACLHGLTNPAAGKIMTESMVSGGFWCSAPRGLKQMVGVTTKCTFTAYLPQGKAVPEDARNVNTATNGWDIVWLPHGKGLRDFGFSGNWVGFSCDNKLFPGDVVVCEVLPKEEHRRRQQEGGGEPTTFGLVFHVFKAMDFETEKVRAARLADAANEEEEGGEEEEEEVGEPAAVQTAAAELSQDGPGDHEEDEEEEQEVEEEEQEAAPSPPSAPKRKRQAQLTALDNKRQKQAGPAAKTAVAAKAGAGASKAAASKAAASKAAASKTAAAKQVQQQGKKGRAPAGIKAAARGKAPKAPAKGEEAAGGLEEGVFWVERILAVQGEGDARTFNVKWWGYEETTWEPRSSLDQPLHTYALAEGVELV